MKPNVATLVLGILAGAVLSAARAPGGLTFADVAGVRGEVAAAFRALAFVALAMGLSRARALSAGVRPAVLLAGAAVGYALHGLVLGPWLEVTGWVSLGLVLLAAVLLPAAAGADRAPGPGEADAPPEPSGTERAGVALSGAGAVIGLDAVARSLRLLGGATPADDTVFGVVLAVWLALGAAAFGPILARGGRARFGIAAGLALGTWSLSYSAEFLEGLAYREGLDGFLRSPPWDLDLAFRGMLQGDTLVAGRVLVVPGFVLGAGLFGLRDRGRWAALLGGCGLGSALAPVVVELTAGGLEHAELPGMLSTRIAVATTVAGIGAIVAALPGPHPRPLSRVGAVAAGAVAIGTIWVQPSAVVLPISPWERFSPTPKLVTETAEGLITVEPTRDFAYVVTLDRRRLSPDNTSLLADEQRIRFAWSLLPEDVRAGRRARVLVVGALTPGRAGLLERLGAQRIDRTAAWHSAMERVEEVLYSEAGRDRPAGDVIDPGEARERLNSSTLAYDLILVPPVEGDAPLARPPGRSKGVFVQWLDAGGDPARRGWSDRVMLSSDGFEDLAIGVVDGAEARFPVGGRRRPAPGLQLLLTRPFDRATASRTAALARLADAAGGDVLGPLTRGLQLHVDGQVQSSPFETSAQSVELVPGVLEEIGAATLAEEPDPFLRELVEGIARLLVEKREIDLIYSVLEPLAKEHAPWPMLERALAHADFEVLEPELGARRLATLLESQPYDIDLRVSVARGFIMANLPAEAVPPLRQALALQPGRRDLERLLAIALVRTGDAEGSELIEDLLLDEPDDAELRPYLEPGPWPPMEAEFVPFGGMHDHAEHAGETEAEHEGHGHDDHEGHDHD